jgi:hypothetical protein
MDAAPEGAFGVTATDLRAALRCQDPRCACHGPRGRAHCPAHDDTRPSFDITKRAERVLFICRAGCGQADVIAALRARGLWGTPRVAPARPAPTLLEAPRTEAVARERAAGARWAPHRRAWAAADEYRETIRQVASARALATAAGRDAPGVWDALTLAARAEIDAEVTLAEAQQ